MERQDVATQDAAAPGSGQPDGDHYRRCHGWYDGWYDGWHGWRLYGWHDRERPAPSDEARSHWPHR